MSLAIITKKFIWINRNLKEETGYGSACTDEKNNYLRQRLLKIQKPNKAIYPSFKKFWFCIDCRNVFSLKPSKKYKTVQRFLLQCPSCKSQRVARNSNIVSAIINKKSVNELLKVSDENNLEVDYKIKNMKYDLRLSSNNSQKKLPDFVIGLY